MHRLRFVHRGETFCQHVRCYMFQFLLMLPCVYVAYRIATSLFYRDRLSVGGITNLARKRLSHGRMLQVKSRRFDLQLLLL